MKTSRSVTVLGLVLGIAVIAVPGRAMTQAPSSGDRVRVVRVPDWTQIQVGTFERIAADSVWLVPTGRAGAIGIALDRGVRLEQSLGRRNQGLTGALVGLGIGAGAWIGALSMFCSSPSFECDELAMFVFFGVPPTAIGVVVGSLMQSEQWAAVPLIAPGPNRTLRLGLSMRL
jgi:hypothetical protein